VPMAPPMDMPPPPPPPPGPPGPPGAPGGFHGGVARRVVSARVKEEEESARWGLPLLPALSPTALNDPAAATDPAQRVVLKKLHWVPLAPEDFMLPQPMPAPSPSMASKQTQQQQVQTNVWKDLFTRAQERASEHAAAVVQRNNRSSDANDEESGGNNLSELAVPLVPEASSSNADPSTAVVPSSSSSASTSTSFSWRWDLDPRSFARLFAQKAAGAMKRKPVAPRKINKYSLGRAGAKELAERMAAARAEGTEIDEAEVLAAMMAGTAGAVGGAGGGDDDDNSSESSEEGAEDGFEDDGVTPRRRRKGKSEGSSSSLTAPVARVELVDAKRSYNVSISLTSFRGLSAPSIRDAILALDSGRLGGLDALEVLEDLIPSSEEASLVSGWVASGGDIRALGNVEQFFLAMSVPHVRERLKLLVFLESFGFVARRVEDALETVQAALESVQAAGDRIAIILAIVLRVGNLMNASAVTWTTPAGAAIGTGQKALPPGKAGPPVVPVQVTKQCYGFHLPSTLSKLRGVRALPSASASTALVASSSSASADDDLLKVGPHTGTLLHFLVRYVGSRVRVSPPMMAVFLAILPGLREAARVEQAFLMAEVKQLGQNLALTKQMIEEDERAVAAAGEAAPMSPVQSPVASSPANATSALIAPPPYVPLPPRVREFYAYASSRLAALQAQLSSVRALHQSLQAYYLLNVQPSGASSSSSSAAAAGGADPNAWESFAALWADFLADWIAAEEEVAEERAQEAKKLRQAEAARALKAKREEAARIKAAAGAPAGAQGKQVALSVPSAVTIDPPMLLSTGTMAPVSGSSSSHSAAAAGASTPSQPQHQSGAGMMSPPTSSPSLSLGQSLRSFLSPAMSKEQEDRARAAASAAQLAAMQATTGDFSGQGSVERPFSP